MPQQLQNLSALLFDVSVDGEAELFKLVIHISAKFCKARNSDMTSKDYVHFFDSRH